MSASDELFDSFIPRLISANYNVSDLSLELFGPYISACVYALRNCPYAALVGSLSFSSNSSSLPAPPSLQAVNTATIQSRLDESQSRADGLQGLVTNLQVRAQRILYADLDHHPVQTGMGEPAVVYCEVENLVHFHFHSPEPAEGAGAEKRKAVGEAPAEVTKYTYSSRDTLHSLPPSLSPLPPSLTASPPPSSLPPSLPPSLPSTGQRQMI